MAVNMNKPPIEHELHTRRAGRNIAVLCALVCFVVLVIALTIVKMRSTGYNEGYDHVLRPAFIDKQDMTKAKK